MVDANNVNAVSGTYHIKCNDIFGRLAYKLQIYKDGKPIGDPLTEDITAKNNAATNWYGAYLFPPGKRKFDDREKYMFRLIRTIKERGLIGLLFNQLSPEQGWRQGLHGASLLQWER